MECRRVGLYARDRIDPKFEVLGSKFRKPRTSDLEPSPVSRAIPLCVAAVFSLFVFVDELLEFIEFA